MSRKILTVLILLLLALPQPGPAQTEAELEQFVQALVTYLVSEDLASAAQLIQNRPDLATQAFTGFEQALREPGMDQQNRQVAVLCMNVIALVFEQMGQPDLKQRLVSQGLLLDAEGGTTHPPQAADPPQTPQAGGADYGLYGLNRPSSTLEGQSGLLADDRYLKAKTGIMIGAYAWASSMLEPLVEDPGLNDQQRLLLALRGYQLESAMGFAEWLKDREGVAAVEGRLPVDDRMSLYVAAMKAASKTGQVRLAAEFLKKAEALAPSLPTPDGNLARFLVKTVRFDLDFTRNPEISQETFQQRFDEAMTLLASTPPDSLQSPLMWKWALEEVHSTWVVDMLYWAAYNGLEEDPRALAFAEKILMGSVETAFGRTSQAGQNFELEMAGKQMALSMGQGLPSVELVQTVLSHLEPQIADLLTLKQGLEQETAGLPEPELLKGSDFTRMLAAYHDLKARLVGLQNPEQMSAATYEQARAEAEKAVALYIEGLDVSGAINMANFVGDVALRAKPPGWAEQVEQLMTDAIQLCQQTAFLDGEITARYLRAQARRASGNRPGAVQDLTRARDLIEDYIAQLGGTQQGATFIRKMTSNIYDQLAELQLGAGQKEDAFATLSRRLQLDTLASLDFDRLQKANPEIAGAVGAVEEQGTRTRALQLQLETEKSLPSSPEREKQIQRTSALLAQNKADFIKVRDQLSKKLGPAYDSYFKLSPVDLARAQKDLPADTALLLVFFTEEAKELHLFVITSTEFRVRTVTVEPGEVDRLVQRFRRLCGSYVRAGGGKFSWTDPALGIPLKDVLTKLNSILIAPVEQDLAGKKVLAFVPLGALRYMPLQAVARDRDGKVEFLAERMQVVTLSQAGDLSQLKEAPLKATGQLVAFGNPDGSLPSAAHEVLELKTLFPDARVFVEGQATTAKVLASTNVGYLHLATHGVLDSRNPDASYLVLADEGKLTRYEIIANLDLAGTRVVTLSACDTNLGERNPGNEVTSMAQTFWLTGTPTVVASLWKVSDQSTEQWMVEFYRRVQAGENLGAALQGAQLKLIGNPESAHPYHWAPFVLWGDWR